MYYVEKSALESWESEDNNSKRQPLLRFAKRRIAYVRLFASRHTESPG